MLLIQHKMLILITIKCLFCSAILVDESEKCDIIQISFTHKEDINSVQEHVYNFTKQKYNKNENPYYYSLHGTKNNLKETIIMWNSTDDAWFVLTRTYDKEDQTDFEPVFKRKAKTSYLSSPHTLMYCKYGILLFLFSNSNEI